MTPRIFIGSSTGSLDIANAIQANLRYYELDITIWSQGIFTPSNYPLEDLLRQLENFDFGIFVFAPDDKVKIRGKEVATVRDNVMFEMGLFIGKLGKERAFFVMPHSNEPFRVATDLLGLNPATFNASNTDKRAALGVACEEIRTIMERLGPKYSLPETLSHLAKKAKEVDDTQIHLYTFCGLQAEKDPDTVRGTVIGLNSVYHMWADPTDQSNSVQAKVVLDQDPNFFRIQFRNSPGSYPANVTIRPCGLYALRNPKPNQKNCLAMDARAIPLKEDIPNKCSEEIGLSFRLIDGLATYWAKGIADPEQECLPVDGKWHSFYIDLTKEWFLFTADGNHYYSKDKDKIEFSIIAAVVIEFGSKGGPRLGAGYGQVEITDVRLCNHTPASKRKKKPIPR